MDERRAVVQRVRDVGDRAERLVLDLDELGRVLRERVSATTTATPSPTCAPRRTRAGSAAASWISSVTGHAQRQRAGPVGGELGAAERGDDALHLARRGEVDAADPRACAYGLRTTASQTCPGRLSCR